MQDLNKSLTGELVKVLDFFKSDLRSLRTGRANVAMLDNVKVVCYGAETALNQVASVSVQGARTLVVEPWDKNCLKDIDKALQETDLGASPAVDGNVVRVNLPEPTEERRLELVKILHEKMEQAKVSVRKQREKVWKELEAMKEGASEDEMRSLEKELQEVVKDYNGKIEVFAKEKEEEIMTV